MRLDYLNRFLVNVDNDSNSQTDGIIRMICGVLDERAFTYLKFWICQCKVSLELQSACSIAVQIIMF